MSDYSIMMLDANEITNQVDISLKDYSDDNIESIKAAVLSHGGKTDYLNFIDDSNKVIRSTVGYETDNNASPFSLYGGNPASFTAKASTTATETTKLLPARRNRKAWMTSMLTW